MAAIIGRGLVGLLGAASAYGVYQSAIKTIVDNPPMEREFLSTILFSSGKKTALAATTIGALALTYCLIRGSKEPESPELPLKVSAIKLEESIIAGSELTERSPPNFQGFIARKTFDKIKGESLEVVGCCIRTQYGVWVPSHVLGHDYETMYVVGRKQQRLKKGGEVEFFTPTIPLKPYFSKISESEQFGAEIISLPLDAKDMSQLGLVVGKFAVLSGPQMATIVGPGGKSSMGEIRPGSVIGSIKYNGSTQAGFSGAPYVLNGRIVGIHLHGGPGGNGGQEIQYLNQLYKIAMNIVEESTNFLDSGAKIMELALKNKRALVAEEQGDYMVYRDDGGHYHRVTKQTYRELNDKYQPQQFQDEDWEDDSEASYYGGDPEEWDRYNQKGRYSEESKRPFLSRGSKSSPKGPRTQRGAKKPLPIEMRIRLLQQRLEKLQNSKKPSQCSPQTPQLPAPSTPLSSSSTGGGN